MEVKLLINEVVEVREYLEGNNIVKNNLFRTCYLLAKYYKEKGMSPVEIRKSIFDWAKENKIYIIYNLNNIIYQALRDKQRLKDNITIKINQKDIDNIKSRFDSKNTRLTALALLCYAKAYADRDKEFTLSSVSLGAWIGIADSHLRGTYLKEVIDFEYVSKVESTNSYSWNKSKKNKSTRYKINVDIHNSGEIQLINNDIRTLYNQIFC